MTSVTIGIDGMACEMCEAHMKELIRKEIPDAKKVKASFRKGTCSFLTEQEIKEDSLKQAVKNIGYEILNIKSEPYEKKSLFKWR
ncbi:MAG: cation transporter [Lachnospiraceae bacterium]|nr:cation transporter [Lachnospiraceae bacterium]